MGRRLAAILGLSLAATVLPALPVAAVPASAPPGDVGCSQPTRVLTGGSPEPITLGADETVLLESGSFSGALEGLPAGSRLCIAPGATLSAPSIGSAAGLIVNAGTMVIPGFAAEPGFELHNSGSLLVTGGAHLGVGGRIDNVCRLAVRGTLTNAGDLSNSGSIGLPAGGLHNSGSLRQDESGVITGVDFTNDGQITGAGAYGFSGLTTNTGAVFGDSADHPIVLDDTTPTGQAVFDAGTGRARNVVRATVTPAPTDRPAGCTTPDPEPVADIAVTVTGPRLVYQEDRGTFQVVVTNTGPGAAGSVVVFADFLPVGLVATASDGGIASDGALSWRLGAMAMGETRTLTIDGTANEIGELTYRVSTWSSTPDPVSANNDGSQADASGSTRVSSPGSQEPIEPKPVTPPPVPQLPAPGTPPVNQLPNSPTNRPPVVEDAEVSTVAMTDVSGTIEAVDPDTGQSVTFTLATPPASGDVDIDRDGQFRYSPAGSFTGRDDFIVRGCDDGSPARCDEATISIAVLPAPRDDTVMTWAGKPIGVDVDDNDLGGASDPNWVVGPQHGSAVTEPTMVYTPGGTYTGWDTMTYQTCAPEAPDVCSQATLKVGVLPLAEDDFFSTPEGRAFLASAAANDFGDAGDFKIIDEPDFGDVEDFESGDFLYTPDEDFVGEDAFTYQVCSPNAPDLCDVGVVKMRVDDVIEPATLVDSADADDREMADTAADTDAAPRAPSASGLSPGPVLAAGLVTGGLVALAWRWRRIRSSAGASEPSA